VAAHKCSFSFQFDSNN